MPTKPFQKHLPFFFLTPLFKLLILKKCRICCVFGTRNMFPTCKIFECLFPALYKKNCISYHRFIPLNFVSSLASVVFQWSLLGSFNQFFFLPHISALLHFFLQFSALKQMFFVRWRSWYLAQWTFFCVVNSNLAKMWCKAVMSCIQPENSYGFLSGF